VGFGIPSWIALFCLAGQESERHSLGELREQAVGVVCLLEKRGLSALVKKGMTTAEVERILGLPTSRFRVPGRTIHDYADAGVCVFFEWDCPRKREFAPDIGEYIYVWDLGPSGSCPPGKYHDRVVRVEYKKRLRDP